MTVNKKIYEKFEEDDIELPKDTARSISMYVMEFMAETKLHKHNEAAEPIKEDEDEDKDD